MRAIKPEKAVNLSARTKPSSESRFQDEDRGAVTEDRGAVTEDRGGMTEDRGAVTEGRGGTTRIEVR